MSAPETGPLADELRNLTARAAQLAAAQVVARPLLVLVAVDNPAQPTRPVVEMQGAMPTEHVAAFLRAIADAWDDRLATASAAERSRADLGAVIDS